MNFPEGKSLSWIVSVIGAATYGLAEWPGQFCAGYKLHDCTWKPHEDTTRVFFSHLSSFLVVALWKQCGSDSPFPNINFDFGGYHEHEARRR